MQKRVNKLNANPNVVPDKSLGTALGTMLNASVSLPSDMDMAMFKPQKKKIDNGAFEDVSSLVIHPRLLGDELFFERVVRVAQSSPTQMACIQKMIDTVVTSSNLSDSDMEKIRVVNAQGQTLSELFQDWTRWFFSTGNANIYVKKGKANAQAVLLSTTDVLVTDYKIDGDTWTYYVVVEGDRLGRKDISQMYVPVFPSVRVSGKDGSTMVANYYQLKETLSEFETCFRFLQKGCTQNWYGVPISASVLNEQSAEAGISNLNIKDLKRGFAPTVILSHYNPKLDTDEKLIEFIGAIENKASKDSDESSGYLVIASNHPDAKIQVDVISKDTTDASFSMLRETCEREIFKANGINPLLVVQRGGGALGASNELMQAQKSHESKCKALRNLFVEKFAQMFLQWNGITTTLEFEPYFETEQPNQESNGLTV